MIARTVFHARCAATTAAMYAGGKTEPVAAAETIVYAGAITIKRVTRFRAYRDCPFSISSSSRLAALSMSRM